MEKDGQETKRRKLVSYDNDDDGRMAMRDSSNNIARRTISHRGTVTNNKGTIILGGGNNDEKAGLTPVESLVSGMTAGAVSSLCTYPLDMARAQLAVLRKKKKPTTITTAATAATGGGGVPISPLDGQLGIGASASTKSKNVLYPTSTGRVARAVRA